MSLNTCTAFPAKLIKAEKEELQTPQLPLLPQQKFPISKLPPELRRNIYALYLTSLNPISVTTENASHPLHEETPLSLSSPFFSSEISHLIFHHSGKFSFSSGEAMKIFSSQLSRCQQVRRIRIAYGKEIDCPNRDWVVLIDSCFENLEEVTFSVERSKGEGVVEFGGLWWECMRDAVREGGCGRRKKPLMLRVESGEWSASERIENVEKREE
jgi:hypothetical protein